jgi:hypothetical protein
MSPPFIEAPLAGRRAEAKAIGGFRLPEGWPDPHDERFLRLRLRQMAEDPTVQPWLMRAMVSRDREHVMLGHIGFHGPPDGRGRRSWGTRCCRRTAVAATPWRRRGG